MKRVVSVIILLLFLMVPFLSGCGEGDDWSEKSSNDPYYSGPGEPLSALEFDLSESIGVVGVKSGDLQSSSAGGGELSAEALSSDTPIKKVLINGTLASITNYTLPIQGYYISPSGDLYILLSSQTTYADDTGTEYQCILFKVLQDNTFECIDSTGQYTYGGYSTGTVYNPAVQFDNAGNVYYKVSTLGTALLRRNSGGVINDLTNDNMYISEWLVAPDGTVFLSGSTSSNGNNWFRRLDSSGSLSNLIATGASLRFMKFFPDGKIYFGDWGQLFGVGKTNVGATSLNEACLMGSTINSVGDTWCDPLGGTALAALYKPSDLCTANGLPNTNADCGLNGYVGTNLHEFFLTPNNEVYVIVSSGSSDRQLWRYYPYPSITFLPTTIVPDIRKAVYMTGDRIVMYGIDASQKNKLVLYDISGATETDLLPSDDVEIYHLNVRSDGKIWFDGLNFANNSFAIGYVDTADSNNVTYVKSTNQKLLDFQTF